MSNIGGQHDIMMMMMRYAEVWLCNTEGAVAMGDAVHVCTVAECVYSNSK